jgi:hypothetical protein
VLDRALDPLPGVDRPHAPVLRRFDDPGGRDTRPAASTRGCRAGRATPRSPSSSRAGARRPTSRCSRRTTRGGSAGPGSRARGGAGGRSSRRPGHSRPVPSRG